MMLKDYYEILGVNQKASAEEIREAYKKLAKAFHPDKHQGDTFFTDKFKSLQEAYNILSDTNKRGDYDNQLVSQMNKSAAQSAPSSSSERTSTGESAPPSTSVIDLPTLIDMYFNKRIATVQARKFYDGFLATPRERHITWLKFIIVLLIIGLNLLLFNPSWGFLKDLLP